MILPADRIPLHTERLTLRELAESDFDAVHEYASDPMVVRFMPWGPNSPSNTLEFLKRVQQAAAARPRVGYELGITLSDRGTLLGAMGLHREDADASDAMLGYCLARPAWGRGYATEAGLAMLHFGFSCLELESIWAGCDVENLGSIRVLEKLGMTLQSRHRHDTEIQGEWRDSLMFRIEASEWGGALGPSA